MTKTSNHVCWADLLFQHASPPQKKAVLCAKRKTGKKASERRKRNKDLLCCGQGRTCLGLYKIQRTLASCLFSGKRGVLAKFRGSCSRRRSSLVLR